MLLNLSNHPSTKWSTAQTEKVKELYGEVSDLPFPNINPAMTTEEVDVLAQEYYTKVLDLKPQAVHLMGEMTFTFTLVRKLQKAGISCVASTTERNVIEEKDGKKTLIFNFIQFRAYPEL